MYMLALSNQFSSLLSFPSAAALSLFQDSASATEEGLTAGELVASLPADVGSLVALALLVGFAGVVIYYGQKPGAPKVEVSQDPADPVRPSVR